MHTSLDSQWLFAIQQHTCVAYFTIKISALEPFQSYRHCFCIVTKHDHQLLDTFSILTCYSVLFWHKRANFFSLIGKKYCTLLCVYCIIRIKNSRIPCNKIYSNQKLLKILDRIIIFWIVYYNTNSAPQNNH